MGDRELVKWEIRSCVTSCSYVVLQQVCTTKHARIFIKEWLNSQKWLVKSSVFLIIHKITKSLLKMISINFFCIMETSKKSGVGHVKV